MNKYDLNALVASSPMNVSYFTDLDCWLYRIFRGSMLSPGGRDELLEAYAIFPRDGEPTLILGAGAVSFATHLWIKNIKTYGNSELDFSFSKDNPSPWEKRVRELSFPPEREGNAAEALIASLKDGGIAKGRIGVESSYLHANFKKKLKKSLPKLSLLDSTELLRHISMVKTKEEISRLKKSAEINEKAGVKSLMMAKPNTTVSEVFMVYNVECTKMGGEIDHFIYSPYGVGITAYPNYVLKQGEALYVDFGCVYQMYYSDAGATLILGKPSNEQIRIYNCLRDAIDRCLDSLKPGVNPSLPLILMREHLGKNGIQKCNVQIHGIGLEPRGYPIIQKDLPKTISDDVVKFNADIPLEENMVINIETPYYYWGVGGFHIEKTFVITSKGFREITRQDREKPFIIE